MKRRKRKVDAASFAELNRNSSKKIIARAFGQQVFFRALGILANIVTVTATTRYLGPSLYGTLTTAVIFVGLWTSLTELGIGSVIVRRVTAGKGSLERLIRVNAGMSLVYALPLFAVATLSGVAVYRGQEDVVKLILITSISLLLTTVSSCFQPAFFATVRFTAVAVSDLLSRIASLALTLVLVNRGADLTWFAVVQLMPPAVVLLIQGVAASRIVNCRPVFSMKEGWLLLRESLPQTATLIIGVLYWRIDGVILSLRSTHDEVGVYGLAYTLAFTVSILPSFFGTSTISAMTRLYAADRNQFANFVTRSVEVMLFIGAPIAVVGAVCAPQIVGIIGTAEFVAQGGPTLALLLVAAAIGFLTGVLSQALFSSHDQIFLLRLNVCNLVVNIALNIVLTPVYGAVGAAIAMVVTELVGLIIASWRLGFLTSYRIPWGFCLRLLIPVLASGAVAAAAHNVSVFVILPLAAIVYLAINLLSGPVTVSRVREMTADTNETG